jgi:hypothetical protein
MFPTSATLKLPNSGTPEFDGERAGVRGNRILDSQLPLTRRFAATSPHRGEVKR